MLSSLTHIPHLPFAALHQTIMLTTSCVPFSLFLWFTCKWFLEMSPRSRNKKKEEFSSITSLVPSVGTRLNPQRTPWTTHPSCQGTCPQTLIPLSWGLPSAWEVPVAKWMLFWTPEEALGQSKRDPEARMWRWCCQRAGDYAPQGHPSHQRAIGKWHKSGSMPATAPPRQAPTWLLQHLPLLPISGSNFSAFTI